MQARECVLEECDDGIDVGSAGKMLKQDGSHGRHTCAAAYGLHLLVVCLQLRIVSIGGLVGRA